MDGRRSIQIGNYNHCVNQSFLLPSRTITRENRTRDQALLFKILIYSSVYNFIHAVSVRWVSPGQTFSFSESMSHALRVVIHLDADLYGDNMSQVIHRSWPHTTHNTPTTGANPTTGHLTGLFFSHIFYWLIGSTFFSHFMWRVRAEACCWSR
jgi:hypothetical protein